MRAAVRHARARLPAARDRLLTVAAVATILAATFGLGPFEGRMPADVGTIDRVAAIR